MVESGRPDQSESTRDGRDLAGLNLAGLGQPLGEHGDRFTRFDPRARLILAALLALTVVSLQTLSAGAVALLAAGAIAGLGGVSPGRLRALLPLELLMLVLLLTLPFSVPGTPLLAVGPLVASREGGALALLILFKANAVVLILFGLVGSLGAGPTVHALARLGLPAKLCQMLLLTLRQVDLVGDEYARMRLAMRARAFVPRSDRQSWRALGWLIGMLLVRSLARARRVADAMRCRGFDGRLHLLRRFRWQRRDTLLLLGLSPLLVGLLMLDRWGWSDWAASHWLGSA